MPSLQLEAEPLLGGFQESFDDTELSEATELAIVSIAIPLDGEQAFKAALSKAFGIGIPSPGQSVLSADGKTRFLWTGQDQLFALFEAPSPRAAADLGDKLGNAVYVTLQSDNWVALRISGRHARAALERICPIDLDPSAFPEGCAARTVMEHMGAFILRDGADSFVLLSASSSAQSFLHAVKTSIENVS